MSNNNGKLNDKFKTVSLNELMPGRVQPRFIFDYQKMYELAYSIFVGDKIHTPLLVEPQNGNDYHLIIAGERRWRSACATVLFSPQYSDNDTIKFEDAIKFVCKASPGEIRERIGEENLKKFTVDVKLFSGSEEQLMKLGFFDNLFRDDLKPIEEGLMFVNMQKKYGWSIRKIAINTNRSKSQISERIRLTNLDEATHDIKLPYKIALEIAKLPQLYHLALAENIQLYLKENPSQKAKMMEIVKGLAWYIDLDNWTYDDIKTPSKRNTLKMVQHTIKTFPPAKMVALMFALIIDNNLTLPISKEYVYINTICKVTPHQTQDNFWKDEVAKSNDFTCEHCQLRHIINIENRDKKLDKSLYCKKLNSDQPATIKTCLNFIHDDEPFYLYFDWLFRHNLPKHLANQITWDCGPTLGPLTPDQSVQIYQAVVDTIKSSSSSTSEETIMNQPEKPATEQYYDMQNNGCFDLGHIHAQPCHNCHHFRQNKCQLPIGKEIYNCYFVILIANDGSMYPRCSYFSPLKMPIIPQRLDFTSNSLSKLAIKRLITWFMSRLDKFEEYMHGEYISSPLAWLPYKRGKKKYNRKNLAKYLTQMAQTNLDVFFTIADHGHKEVALSKNTDTTFANLINPISGELEKFAFIRMFIYEDFNNTSFHSYPSDWPTPTHPEEEK